MRQQLAIKPADGGALVTRASSVDAGAPRYSQKQNFRRDLSDEMMREGQDYFNPLPEQADYRDFPFPGDADDPLTVIHHVRRPNGESAVVVGTKSALWRFNTSLAGYVSGSYALGVNDGPGGTMQPYFAVPERWQVIGSGFSVSGRRWEVSSSNGSSIFSNGSNLPVEYRVEYWDTRPLYELREQGVISLGTIGDHNSIFMGGDVLEVASGDIDEVLGVRNSGTITVVQAGQKRSGSITATSVGTAVTASAGFFAAGDVGRIIIWSDGQRQTISAFVDTTHLTVTPALTIAAHTFWITDARPSPTATAFQLRASASFFTPEMEGWSIAWDNGLIRKIATVVNGVVAITDIDFPVGEGVVTYDNPNAWLGLDDLQEAVLADRVAPLQTDHRQYRLLWSELDQPTRFAIRVGCSFLSGSRVLLTSRTTASIVVGDVILVEGAGAAGGNLQTTVTSSGFGIITIASPTLSGGSGFVSRVSSIGSTAGFEDLQDDGSAILKIAPLRDRAVVYKDNNLFVARYTGLADRPFEFTRVVTPHGRGLYFRHTLTSINGMLHLYAGRNRFYSFDLTSVVPQPIESGDLVSNLFFDHANIADTEDIFASDNPLTQEVWITCPSAPSKTLAFDHVYRTWSTIDFAPTAAAAIKDPSGVLDKETSNWFLMGTEDGTLLQYGLADKPTLAWNTKNIWYRRGARPYSAKKESYEAVLSSGLIDFGDPYNEKHITAYTLQFSSLQVVHALAEVRFYTAMNENSPQREIGRASIGQAARAGLIPLHTIAHCIRDEIRTNIQLPIRVHQRVWDFNGKDTRSHHRQ